MAQMLRELTVMNDLAQTLSALSNDELRRVISWLEDYFDIYEDDELYAAQIVEEAADPVVAVVVEDEPVDEPIEDDVEEVEDEVVEAEEPAPETFETFIARVAPKTAIQKIVTSAYWLETQGEQDSWTSFQANKLLKSLDIKVSSVSGTLAIEAKKADPMIVVLEKSGDSMQGRKTFRLSDAGFDFVEGRL